MVVSRSNTSFVQLTKQGRGGGGVAPGFAARVTSGPGPFHVSPLNCCGKFRIKPGAKGRVLRLPRAGRGPCEGGEPFALPSVASTPVTIETSFPVAVGAQTSSEKRV